MKTYFIYTERGIRFLGTIKATSLEAARARVEGDLILPCLVLETPPNEL